MENLLQLPPDLLHHVLTYVPAPDIARASTASRAFHAIANASALWKLLFINDFDISAHDVYLLNDDAKGSYAQRVRARRQRLDALSRMRVTHAANEVAQRGGDAVSAYINAWNICTFLLLPFILILIFFALLSARLDGTVALSWVRVFSPLFVLGGLLALSFLVAAIVVVCAQRHAMMAEHMVGPRYSVSSSSSASVWARVNLDTLAWAPPISILRSISAVDHPFAWRVRPVLYAHVALFVLAMLLVPVGLCLKLDAGGASWGLALAPVWVSVALFCCAGCAGWLHNARQNEGVVSAYIGSVALLACPAVIAAALVAVAADGLRAIPLQQAFAPLWIALGTLMLPLALGVCVLLFKVAWDRDLHEFGAVGGMLAALCALVAPVTLSLVFVVLRVQGVAAFAGMAWGSVLAPLMLELGIIALLMCIGGCALCASKFRVRVQRAMNPPADVFSSPV